MLFTTITISFLKNVCQTFSNYFCFPHPPFTGHLISGNTIQSPHVTNTRRFECNTIPLYRNILAFDTSEQYSNSSIPDILIDTSLPALTDERSTHFWKFFTNTLTESWSTHIFSSLFNDSSIHCTLLSNDTIVENVLPYTAAVTKPSPIPSPSSWSLRNPLVKIWQAGIVYFRTSPFLNTKFKRIW